MASNTQVGTVTRMNFKIQNPVATESREYSVNTKLIPISSATYADIAETSKYLFNSSLEAVQSLSYNTWQDTILITTVSVTEQAAQ